MNSVIQMQHLEKKNFDLLMLKDVDNINNINTTMRM